MSVMHLMMKDRKVCITLSRAFLSIISAFDSDGSSHLQCCVALDKETFETMWRDSDPDGREAVAGLFFRHTHTEFRADGIDPSPWLDYMPNVRYSF